MSHSTFYKCVGSYTAVFLKQFSFKRTAVDADSDRDFSFLCHFDNLLYSVAVTDIAGINSDFIRTVFHTFQRKTIIKMYIDNKRYMDLLFYIRYGFSRNHIRHCDANYLTACIFKFMYLIYRCFDISCVGITHRLNCNGIVTADFHTAYIYNSFLFSHKN